MLTNKLMDVELEKLNSEFIKRIILPQELEDILSEGFTKKNGCFLSKKLLKLCSSVSYSNFEDEIAYECFVNSLHMEDYVNKNHLDYSVVFCNKLIEIWRENEMLNVIMTLDDETFLPTVKFHVKRDNVSWLNEDELD